MYDWRINKNKGKTVPVHAIKHTEGAEIQFHSFLNSALDGGKRPTSRNLPLCPRERTQLKRRLDGPHSLSGRFGEDKIYSPYRGWSPGYSRPFPRRYIDYATRLRFITGKKSKSIHKRPIRCDQKFRDLVSENYNLLLMAKNI